MTGFHDFFFHRRSPDPTFPASHPEESTISRAGLGGKGPALSTIVSSGAKATTDGPPSGTKREFLQGFFFFAIGCMTVIKSCIIK